MSKNVKYTGTPIPMPRAYVEAMDVKEGDVFEVFAWKGEYYLAPAAVPIEEQIAKLEAKLKVKK